MPPRTEPWWEPKFGKDWKWTTLCRLCGEQAGAHFPYGGDCPPKKAGG